MNTTAETCPVCSSAINRVPGKWGRADFVRCDSGCTNAQRAAHVHYKPGMSEETRHGIACIVAERAFDKRVQSFNRKAESARVRELEAPNKANLKRYGSEGSRARFTIKPGHSRTNEVLADLGRLGCVADIEETALETLDCAAD